MTKTSKLISIFMAMLLVVSVSTPMFAEAKDSDRGKYKKEVKIELKETRADDREDDREDRKDKHKVVNKIIPPGICKLIARNKVPFGWAKNWFNLASSTMIEDCAKMASSTPPTIDTVAPIIKNIKTWSGTSFTVVTWDTNEKTSSKIYWDSSANVSTSSINVKSSFSGVTHHFVIINGLNAGTEYHALIEATDPSNNTSLSSKFSFTTSGTPVVNPPDVTAPIISSVVANGVSSTTINLTWTTNEPSNSKVYYSTTSPLATSTAQFVSNASLVTNHSIQIGALATGTTYFLVVGSADASNNTSLSPQFSTTTLGL